MNSEEDEFKRIEAEAQRRAAQAKLDDEADTLTIVYQRGFADGKKAAQQQAEPVQERVTHITWDERGVRTVNGMPDDAPQRSWVGLTDEEISDIVADIDVDFGDLLWKVVCLTKIIQAELKERNA